MGISALISASIVLSILALKLETCHADFVAECHKTGISADFHHMHRLRPDSKYGIMADPGTFSYETAVQWCEDKDMDLAKIRNIHDYQSILKFLLDKYPTCSGNTRWLIDGSDSYKEGYWKYSDGSNLTFQAFFAFEPINSAPDAAKTANALAIRCATFPSQDLQGPERSFVYRDVTKGPLDSLAFFCEYKPNTECYKTCSEVRRAEKAAKDEPIPLGDAGKRQYYYSNYMKDWKDSVAYCKANNMRLFDMEMGDEDEATKTYKLLGRFIKDQEMMSLAVGFILYGAFSRLFTGNPVPFEWEWIDDKWRNKRIGGDNSILFSDAIGQMKFGTCMAVGALYKCEDKPLFTLSMAHCSVPHWTICYKG